MIQNGATDRFSASLRALRERAGLSYEALSQKTGISRSSLHRYCAGSSVPQDYGVAHRVATVCGASPAELRELHQLWALADTDRTPPQPESERERESESDRESAESAEPEPEPEPEVPAPGQELQESPEPKRNWWDRNRRSHVSTATAAVAGVVVLALVGWGVSAASSSGTRKEPEDTRLLFSEACRPVVSMGQHDPCVSEVQTLLRRRGADIDVDGDFGPQTLRRVTAFQVFAGIPPNGVVGDATMKALYDSKVRMVTWSPAKVRKRIREVFAKAPDDAVAIADCQSFLDPLHILPNTNGSRNWGLFQLSDARLRELGGTPAKALDPEWNIEAAERLWSRDRDFADWPYCEKALRRP
ncbi:MULTISPECIES: helix-turn-helix domain-containing protein [Streptomyces]|uniref:Helix-turn-helix domain-containing protein n=2 Tax=Streptomyces TaxID=1883 RepID=A0ABV9IYV9_9ACTN